MAEIGNRKERLRDYASFPEWQPHRNPNRTPNARSAIKRESGSEAFLIPLTLLKAAAKQKRGRRGTLGLRPKPHKGTLFP